MLTNKNKTTLYVGVTSDLYHRILQHKNHTFPNAFTAKYNLHCCVYFENYSSIQEAILFEKQLKKWRREKKEQLINKHNPEWKDLWEEIRYW